MLLAGGHERSSGSAKFGVKDQLKKEKAGRSVPDPVNGLQHHPCQLMTMPEIARTSDQVPQCRHNEDRMRRADSWHQRSKEATSDDERFVLLWIAFNAAYGSEVPDSDKNSIESRKFKDFLREVIKRDSDKILSKVVWETFAGPIRVLLGNHYIFTPFWSAVQGSPSGKNWKKQFDDSKKSVHRYMGKDVHRVLTEVFFRLYTLRNQIFHGGTTFATGWGRDQVRDGSRIMASLVPVILEIMRTDIKGNPDSDVWGRVAYPRFNYDRQ